MYLFKEFSLINLIVILGIWGASGWVLVLKLFDIPNRERILVGLGLGLVINNWLANIAAHWISPYYAFSLTVLVSLCFSVVGMWYLRSEILSVERISWGDVVLFGTLTIAFTLIGRGLAIYDDYQNLAVVSLMSTGDIPPHFPLEPSIQFGYHYFLLLFATQINVLANTVPWTSMDLARAIFLSLTLLLGALWTERITSKKWAGFFAFFFLAFAGGARWILLFVPRSLLDKISTTLSFYGAAVYDSGNSLAQLLKEVRHVDGSGPILFPYAFLGSDVPFFLLHNGFGVSPILILFLLLLLAQNRKNKFSNIILAVLLASLALSNEVTYVLIYAGLLFALLFSFAISKDHLNWIKGYLPEIVVLATAGISSLLQGGMLTEVARNWFLGTSPSKSFFQLKFDLVPPAFFSVHFGSLELLNPSHWIVLISEMGTSFLILPVLLAWAIKGIKENRWFDAGFALSAIAGIFTLFLHYSGNVAETSTTRLFAHSLTVFKMTALPLAWIWLGNKTAHWQKTGILLALATMFGGIALFMIQLIGVPWPVYSYFLDQRDVQMYNQYWNKLEPGALIFDPIPYRSPVVFGRFTKVGGIWDEYDPNWLSLVDEPDLALIRARGFDYIYYDQSYYAKNRTYLDNPCGRLIKELKIDDSWRRLIEIKSCQK